MSAAASTTPEQKEPETRKIRIGKRQAICAAPTHDETVTRVEAYRIQELVARRRMSLLRKWKHGDPDHGSDSDEDDPEQGRSTSSEEPTSLLTCCKKKANSVADSNTVESSDADDESWRLPLNIYDIFWFEKPDFFFKAIEVCLVLNCLYLANWAINFIFIVQEVTVWKSFWQLMMLIPIVLNIPCIGLLTRYSAYLKAFVYLDPEVILFVIESMELKQQLSKQLRERILTSLSATKDKAALVNSVFDSVDVDLSGAIDKMEFLRFLNLFGLDYSHNRYESLFNAVDLNGDQVISKEELHQLVFPKNKDGNSSMGSPTAPLRRMSLKPNSFVAKRLSDIQKSGALDSFVDNGDTLKHRSRTGSSIESSS